MLPVILVYLGNLNTIFGQWAGMDHFLVSQINRYVSNLFIAFEAAWHIKEQQIANAQLRALYMGSFRSLGPGCAGQTVIKFTENVLSEDEQSKRLDSS